MWRISVHPSQQVQRWTYTELSVGYIAQAAGVGRETARQAWHLVREALGWWSVGLHHAQAMGARVRVLAPGGRWGQHLLLTPEAVAAAHQLTRELELGELRTALPTGPGWEPIEPTRKGRHLMACCPWHDDRHPSLLLNVNADGCSGSGVCLACTDEHGDRLRVYWRRHGEAYRARPARSSRQERPAVSGTGTIENQGAEGDRPSMPGRHLLAQLDAGARGMRRRASQCADLLDVLRHADQRSATDRAAGEAAGAYFREQGPGDAFVSVDPMAPVSWRTLDTRRGAVRVPDRWEPTAVRWMLTDLDAFQDGPMDDRALAIGGEALERWARGMPGLSGRVAVIRTSHRGVQAVVELEEAQHDPRRWHRSTEGKALARALDAAALAMARGAGFTGGHADACAHAAGRLMRRPGWRVDKGGDLCRARLVHASGGAAPSR